MWLMTDLSEATPEQLQAMQDEACAELARRQTVRAVQGEVRAVLVRAREGGAVDTPAPGDEWRLPSGAHDAYLAGDEVEHEGSRWVSMVDANVWEPGVSGWRPVSDEGYGVWVQPSGAADAYRTGDVVLFEGGVYRSLIDGNAWSPAAYPSGWLLVTEHDDAAGEDEETPEPEAPAWAPGVALGVGDLVEYQGTVYRVRQAHTTQTGWEPPSLPALFEEV